MRWALILSLARRFANADIPTGPTFAACGDEIARNVAFTAPFSAADVESQIIAFVDPINGISIGCVWQLNCVFCTIHGCRNI